MVPFKRLFWFCFLTVSLGLKHIHATRGKSDNITASDVAKRLMRVIERKKATMTNVHLGDGERPTFTWEDEGSQGDYIRHADNWRVKHLPLGAVVDFLDMVHETYEEEGKSGRYARNVHSDMQGHSVIIGDIHGQLFVMLPLLEDIKNRHPDYNLLPGSDLLICDKRLQYVFLGDFVDRGAHGIEVITLALAYKVLCPHVTILEGNHELANVNDRYGFVEEVRRFEEATKIANKASTPSTDQIMHELQEVMEIWTKKNDALARNGNNAGRRQSNAQHFLEENRMWLLDLANNIQQIDADLENVQHSQSRSTMSNGTHRTINVHASTQSDLQTAPDEESVSMDASEATKLELGLKRKRRMSVQLFRKYLLDVVSKPPFLEESPLYDRFMAIFELFPLIAVVENRALAMHGGLHSEFVDICSEEDFETCLTKEMRLSKGMHDLTPAIEGILWSDPNRDENAPAWSPNRIRGVAQLFSAGATYDFLKKKGLQWLVRGHQSKMEGFEEIYYHRGKNSIKIRETEPADVYPDDSISIFTIFSAGDYCGTLEKPDMRNSAAYLVIGATGVPVVHKLWPENARQMLSNMGKSPAKSLRALEDAIRETSVDDVIQHFETVLRFKSLKEIDRDTSADISIGMNGACSQSDSFEGKVRETMLSAIARGNESGGRTSDEVLAFEAATLIEETGEAPIKPDRLASFTSMDYSIVRVFDGLGGKFNDKQKLLHSIARRSSAQLQIPQSSNLAYSVGSDEIVQKPFSKAVYVLAFSSIDKNADGKISEDELREALTSVQKKLGLKVDVNSILKAGFSVPTARDGMNFEDFMMVMQGVS